MAEERREPQQVRLKIPAGVDDLRGLEPGTIVYLDGIIYTGREGVYKKVIADELSYARKLCAGHNWPIIDVTRRSIEETAAAIQNLYHDRNQVS